MKAHQKLISDEKISCFLDMLNPMDKDDIDLDACGEDVVIQPVLKILEERDPGRKIILPG